eukprot:CAMPEP_0119052500 /NCGR_PEP_ID=MMETSP1177-20130426/73777_1 /TAXON_ID=2985 /ORGANISM="Ochromonas sp, Strain CCMP1899" /LENGTH=335 /DNA_ID=CAMNT_0007032087 /DNA_START=59 /DNA_END=1066 /DNA_ORIENTATION=+
MPTGKFKLSFSNLGPSRNGTGLLTGVTDFIPIGADETTVTNIINKVFQIGAVNVIREVLPLCNSPGVCGVGLGERGFGFTYTVTFISITTLAPVLTVIELTRAGPFAAFLQSSVDIIRIGFYQQVPITDVYGKGIPVPPNPARMGDSESEKREYFSTIYGNNFLIDHTLSPDSNEWLTPFYVMLFDEIGLVKNVNGPSAPPLSLQDSLNKAVWFQRFESITLVERITLPRAYPVSFLKIQREGYGILSLAEVMMYPERLNTFKAYKRGTPVQRAAVTQPYQPAYPFREAFKNKKFDGRWTLTVTQDGTAGTGNGPSLGTISDYVLVITDYAGASI